MKHDVEMDHDFLLELWRSRENEYKMIMNTSPPEWALREFEIIEEGRPKVVSAMSLPAVYYLLDSIYDSYDTNIISVHQIGQGVFVNVRLTTYLEGVTRVRDGTGCVNASGGVRNATAMAEVLAIKNAAKKLGRIFGRDLYANEEPRKLPETPVKSPVETVEIVETVNPVYTMILKAIQSAKTPQDLKNAGQALMDKVEIEHIDGEEFEHLSEMINSKATQFKTKKNEGQERTAVSKGKSKIPGALHARAVNRSGNKSSAGSRGNRGNSKKKVEQSSDRDTNRKV